MKLLVDAVPRRSVLAAIALSLACQGGGKSAPPGDSGAGGSGGTMSAAAGTGGAGGTTSGAAGTGGPGGALGGAAGTGGTTDLAPPASAPGAALYELAREGRGPCAGTSLADVIASVHAGWPALADITLLYQPDRLGDGSFIYAFDTDAGFALVFKRGGGDCPAGCTENEYWYFQTGADCAVSQVGHFQAAWATGNCLMTVGAPMWGLPKAPDPAVVCGADNTPANVSGTYQLQGTGSRQACTPKAGIEPVTPLSLPITLTVTQATGDLAHGTITLSGTGHPLIDGQAVDATFTRRRFTARRSVSNLPATCLDEHTLQVDFDFESGLPGHLQFSEVKSLDCPPGQDYCKGMIGLDLALALGP